MQKHYADRYNIFLRVHSGKCSFVNLFQHKKKVRLILSPLKFCIFSIRFIPLANVPNAVLFPSWRNFLFKCLRQAADLFTFIKGVCFREEDWGGRRGSLHSKGRQTPPPPPHPSLGWCPTTTEKKNRKYKIFHSPLSKSPFPETMRHASPPSWKRPQTYSSDPHLDMYHNVFKNLSLVFKI